MKLAATTSEFVEYRSCPQKAVRRFEGTKFKYLDFNFCESVYKGSSFVEEGWEKMIMETGEEAEKLGMTFCQAHAPCFDPDGPIADGLRGEECVQYTIRAIEACAMLGIKNIVAHTGTHEGMTPKAFFEKNKRFYEKLAPAMEKTGVNVLTENLCGMFGYLRTGIEIKEFLEYVNLPLLHACWDTGHGNLVMKEQYTAIKELGEDLYGLHIHDNLGDRDAHSQPFTGNCNFDAIMQGLLDIDYKGYFTFESTRLLIPGRYRNQWEYQGKPAEKAINPPGELRYYAVQMEYEIGKYILSQYDCFEE